MAARAFVFLLALSGWAVFFYAVDWLIMTAQGLPVGWNLMPLS